VILQQGHGAIPFFAGWRRQAVALTAWWMERRSTPSAITIRRPEASRPGFIPDGSVFSSLIVIWPFLRHSAARHLALVSQFVIPGRATWREPGIHNHEIAFGSRCGGNHVQVRLSGLWIPGSMLRIAPE
jgi:hypothetical protein